MTTYTSTQIRLRSRPQGPVRAGDFECARVDLGDLHDGQVIVRNTWMSVDPYMRRRMNAGRSYVEPFAVGSALSGAAIGEVVASRSALLPIGTTVAHEAGWRDFARVRDTFAHPLDLGLAPASAFLGVLGMPGLTAYVGLLDVAGLRPGDTVFVSGAAGAVGSLAAQLARLRGHRVVGSAGTADKVAWLVDDLGLDAAFDYHAGPVTELLARAAPQGIDVYFDNVGGDHLQAALACANDRGRFAMCGTVSDYNHSTPRPGPANLFEVVSRRLQLRGFIVTDHLDRRDDFLAEVGPLVRDGRIAFRETVVDGLHNAPEALRSLFEGANVGKMLVRL